MGNHDSSRYERKKTYKLKERVKHPKRIKLTKDPAKVIRKVKVWTQQELCLDIEVDTDAS